MAIDKAIYGLHSSGAHFHEWFAETMCDMGFSPSHADLDVWVRDGGDAYEYLVVYVDDLVAVMKDPKAFFDELQRSPHHYTLKGLTEPRYHLSTDYFHDKDGTLCFGAQTYVKRLLTNVESLYGELPHKEKSPLAKNDHPKLDTTDFCSPDEIAKFHSIIGACQWMITLIQFPPEMDENWVRYGLAKLGQISELPNWQRMLLCAYTTQLLHSTGEVCWNNKDSYFIWFEFVC